MIQSDATEEEKASYAKTMVSSISLEASGGSL